MTFLELAKTVLEEIKKPLNANEIWEIALQKGLDKKIGTKGKTPWSTLGAQIYVNIRDKKDSVFAVTETRPKRFYLKALINNQTDLIELQLEETENKIIKSKPQYYEKDLHPFLSYYGYYYLKCYTKTLNHNKSEKKGFGEWVHPDMVGCYFPLDEWKPEVFELSSSIGNVSIRIFSFEIKQELNFNNLREAFFQTVSNSSWANESYLVAAKIQNDEEFSYELKRLSSSFGIGVIKLDIDDPDSSEIILPSRYKEYLDWDTINKLTMNSDFKEFLKRIKVDISSKEIRKEKYDKIFSAEDLIKTIKKC